MADEKALAKKTPEQLVKEDIEKAAGEVEKRLPAGLGINAQQFLGAAVTAVIKTPRLMECFKSAAGRTSVYECLYTAARLGVQVGLLNSAHLVPFRAKTGATICQLILGYSGLRDLAIRSGHVRNAYAHPVYENESFDYGLGDAPYIKHRPESPATRGKLIAFYAVAHLTCGETQVEIMWVDEVNLVRARSRAGKDGPWVTDYVEMGKKTALRRLCKQLPQTADLSEAIQLDGDAEEAMRGQASRPSVGSGADLLRKAAQGNEPETIDADCDVIPDEPPQSPPDALESTESDSDSSTGQIPDDEQFDLSGPPNCPKCGEPMVRRTNKKTGHDFFGCTGYPVCKQIVEIDEAKDETTPF